MRTKPAITSVQLMLMAVGSALVFPYTFLPIVEAPPANQDVWIVLLITFVYILLLNAPMLIIINKFRGINVNQSAEIIFGKFFGKVIMVPFVLFFIYCFTACMLITGHFISSFLMADTPPWALHLCMVVPTCYAAYKGAGTIGRLATFIVPLAILMIAVFLFAGIGEMDFNALLPILADSTFLELNKGAFLTAARYSEILIFFVFAYHLQQKYSINRTYVNALVLFGLCFFGILMPTVLVLGVDFAKLVFSPYFVYTRQLTAFGFLERLQSLNTVVWFPTAILKLTIYQYMASEVFAGIVKAKSHKKFVVPIALIVFAVGFIPLMSKSGTLDFLRSDQVFPFIVLPVIFGLPCLFVIVYLIRKKRIDPVIKRIQEETAAATADEKMQTG